MNHASIVSFLSGILSPEAFAGEIKTEVATCVNSCANRGLGYVVVTDGPSTVITREHAARLLQALLDDRLPFDAVNYLADGLMMSEDFDFADAAVAEAIEFVADDSRPPRSDETRAVLSRLA